MCSNTQGSLRLICKRMKTIQGVQFALRIRFIAKKSESEATSLSFASLFGLGCSLRFAFAFWLTKFAEKRKNSQNPRNNFSKKNLPEWLKFIFFFIILGENIKKTTKIDNEGYYQFEISSNRLIFLPIVQIFLVTYQNDRSVKGCKSPQSPHPRFEDRKWSVGLMVGVRPSDCRSVPGVAIRTNFLALSDRAKKSLKNSLSTLGAREGE